ncbi:hypothetical protein ED312_09835 [Sinomicrobium pectinilyticum]|uniref:Secreted protein n=1 Tax=Sinomicrobium pectinilyticum TaxID=1084421 RepID=A0A3N0EJ56_SINP1|nr:hypothetical protein [Sinomicrobium pectinilyticum]RNL87804.1 hypothetical protein ED312_09835 [Sinomicrobium pectinilyticum]
MKTLLKTTVLLVFVTCLFSCTQPDDLPEETQAATMVSAAAIASGDEIETVNEDDDTQTDPSTHSTGNDSSIRPDNEKD